MPDPVLHVADLSVAAGSRRLLHRVTLEIAEGGVFGIMGPSGAGKSTLLKCMNRLIDLTPGLRVSGQVLFRGKPIYAAGVNADDLRSRIGFLFQQPVVFPKDILANVLFGVRHLGRVPRRDWHGTAEQALREAALWGEVKDRLRSPALQLSVGQQQRLCLARILATGPEVILMDEPTSALDPKSTETIEDLIRTLKQRHTVVLVTHNPAQAGRVCDRLAFLGIEDEAGRVLRHGRADEVLKWANGASSAGLHPMASDPPRLPGLTVRQVAYGSVEYDESVELRLEVLRRPLGLGHDRPDPAREALSTHFAAFHENKVVGTLVLEPAAPGTMKMRAVAACERLRRRGIASALVRAAEEFARVSGHTQLVAHARETALDFYRSHGYEIGDTTFIEVTLPHRHIAKRL